MTGWPLNLDNKGALVLGGGAGMGEATALKLARAGCRVAVFDVELSRAQAVVAKIEAQGGQAFPIAGNAMNDAELKAAIAEAEKVLGGIDVMASIIGMAAWSSLMDMTEEMWDLDHRRNLRYLFIAAKAVAAGMIKRGRGGAMVFIASVDGIRSSPYHASYGAAKAGLIHLATSMTVEWAQYGIRVNVVAPGQILSPRAPLREGDAERKMVGDIPFGKRGAAEDIANATVFFLSDMASYLSGQLIAVDGGWLSQSLKEYDKILAEIGVGGTMGLGVVK